MHPRNSLIVVLCMFVGGSARGSQNRPSESRSTNMACHIFLIIDERGKCGCPKTALSPSVFSFRATTISLLNLLLGQLGTHSTYIYCPFHLGAPI